jgi:hypothetical protein
LYSGEAEVVNMSKQSGNERMYSIKAEGIFFMDQVLNVIENTSFMQPKAPIRSKNELVTISLTQDDQSRYLSHKNVMEKVVMPVGKTQYRVKFGKF